MRQIEVGRSPGRESAPLQPIMSRGDLLFPGRGLRQKNPIGRNLPALLETPYRQKERIPCAGLRLAVSLPRSQDVTGGRDFDQAINAGIPRDMGGPLEKSSAPLTRPIPGQYRRITPRFVRRPLNSQWFQGRGSET